MDEMTQKLENTYTECTPPQSVHPHHNTKQTKITILSISDSILGMFHVAESGLPTKSHRLFHFPRLMPSAHLK